MQEKEEDSENEEDSGLFIGSINLLNNKIINTVNKAWYETLKINNKNIEFKIDTGAEVSKIPFKYCAGIIDKNNIKSTKLILECYGGFKVKPMGTITCNCSFKHVQLNINFVIADVNAKPLLGIEACKQLGLIKNAASVNSFTDVTSILTEYQDVFEGVGTFPESLTIKLKDSAVPVVKPPRRVPLTIRERLKRKLDSLEKNGIIEKVSEPSEWVSNIVIIEKPDKSLRICLDPQDLNKGVRKDCYLIPNINELFAKLDGKEFFSVLDFLAD